MTHNTHTEEAENRRDRENDKFERELQSTLAKFAAVEPRMGLEERILTALRVEQKRAAQPLWLWWRRPVVAALAGVIVVSLSVTLLSGKRARSTAAHQPAPTQSNKHPVTQVVNSNGSPIRADDAGQGKRLKPHLDINPPAVVAATPKLDEFPSPQPLSEQEIILTRYVTNYPEHAALIARARSEELRRDQVEEMGQPSDENSR